MISSITISRTLVALLFCALIAMFVPALRAGAAPKPGCCANMQMPSDSSGCPGHEQIPGDPQQDTSCCGACALGLTLLVARPTPPLIYAATGEESFVNPAIRGHILPHRPPVPPPRSTLA